MLFRITIYQVYQVYELHPPVYQPFKNEKDDKQHTKRHDSIPKIHSLLSNEELNIYKKSDEQKTVVSFKNMSALLKKQEQLNIYNTENVENLQ